MIIFLTVSVVLNIILSFKLFLYNMGARGLVYYIGFNNGSENIPLDEEVEAYTSKAINEFFRDLLRLERRWDTC